MRASTRQADAHKLLHRSLDAGSRAAVIYLGADALAHYRTGQVIAIEGSRFVLAYRDPAGVVRQARFDLANPRRRAGRGAGPMTASSPRGGGMAPAELRLVEAYVWVLDFVSRCALGVDRGDWFYLHDKTGGLATAAQRLSQLAHEAYQAHTQGHGPLPQVVRAAVAWQGRHYCAGRLLHPGPKGRR